MIAASGPPARQPLLGDGNHLIESLLGPRCERFVTCSRRGGVFPFRRDSLRIRYHGEKIPSFSLNDRVRWTDVEDAIVRSMADDFESRTRGFLEDFYHGERFTEIGLQFLWLFEVLI